MEAYELSTPQQLRAGFVGDTEFHYPCAGCRTADALIVGIISDGPPLPGFGNVAVLDAAPGLLALYGECCWPDRVAPLLAERPAA